MFKVGFRVRVTMGDVLPNPMLKIDKFKVGLRVRVTLDGVIVMSDNFHHFPDEIYFQCRDPLLNPCARKLNTKCKVLPFIVV